MSTTTLLFNTIVILLVLAPSSFAEDKYCSVNQNCPYDSINGKLECGLNARCEVTGDFSNGALQADTNSDVTLKNIKNGASITANIDATVHVLETAVLATSNTANVDIHTNSNFLAPSVTGGGSISCAGTCTVSHIKMESSTGCGKSSLQNFEGFYHCSHDNFTAVGTITGTTVCDSVRCFFNNVQSGSLSCGSYGACTLLDETIGIKKGDAQCKLSAKCDFKFIQDGNLHCLSYSECSASKGVNGNVNAETSAVVKISNGAISGTATVGQYAALHAKSVGGTLNCDLSADCKIMEAISESATVGQYAVLHAKSVGGTLNCDLSADCRIHDAINGSATAGQYATLIANSIGGTLDCSQQHAECRINDAINGSATAGQYGTLIANSIGGALDCNQQHAYCAIKGAGTIYGNVIGGTYATVRLKKIEHVTGSVTMDEHGDFYAPVATIDGNVIVGTYGKFTAKTVKGSLDCGGTCATLTTILGDVKCTGSSCVISDGGVNGDLTCENSCDVYESVKGALTCKGDCSIEGGVSGVVDISTNSVRCKIAKGTIQGNIVSGSSAYIDIYGINGDFDCSKDASHCNVNGGKVSGDFKCGQNGYCNVNEKGNIGGSFDCSADTTHCIVKGDVSKDGLCGTNGLCVYGSNVNGQVVCDGNSNCIVKGNVGKDIECKENSICTVKGDVKGSFVCAKNSKCFVLGDVEGDMNCAEGTTCIIQGKVHGSFTCPSDDEVQCVCAKCKNSPIVPPYVPPVVPPYVPPVVPSDNKKKQPSSDNGAIIAVIVMLCILVTGGIGYFVYSRKIGSGVNRRNLYQFSGVGSKSKYRPPEVQQQTELQNQLLLNVEDGRSDAQPQPIKATFKTNNTVDLGESNQAL